jgi:hypothetical protein
MSRLLALASLVGVVLAAPGGCTVDIADVDCVEGVGAPPQTGCEERRLDCNCRASDGCEIDSDADPRHCGRCGHDCGPGACLDGVCQAASLVELPGPAGALAASGGDVFVAVSASIVRVSPAAAVTTVASGSAPLFAVDAGSLYWIDLDTGSLTRTPLAGGASVTLASVSSSGAIALDETSVVFTDGEGGSGLVRRVPRSGGDAVTLTSPAVKSDLQRIVADREAAYFFRGGLNQDLPSLWSVPLTGGAPSLLLERPVVALAVDASSLYHAVAGEGLHASGKSLVPSTLLAPLPDLRGLTLDGDSLYATTASGDVVRVATSGGPVTTIARGQQGVGEIAADAGAVYWTRSSGTGSALVRLAK